MISPEVVAAAVILASLVLYALSGGADYGGGIWDLLATGPRAKEQRKLVASALGPIWEANHVWLILAIVVLFTAFPPAFAAISISLHLPLTLALIGIVLRGSAFVFRAYDPQPSSSDQTWQRTFAIASLITPFLLGIAAGATLSGRIQPGNGHLDSWMAPLPIAVGCFAVALFAYLAAVYLANEAADPALQADFRARAIGAWFLVVLVGAIALWLVDSDDHAPARGFPITAIRIVSALFALGALFSLWKRHYRAAQLCAAVEVALIVAGWGVAQFPYLIVNSHSIYNAAAPRATLVALNAVIAVGAVVLFPSFAYLYWIFKKSKTQTSSERPDAPKPPNGSVPDGQNDAGSGVTLT